MIDSIKKAMLAGVGAAVLTKDKVEEALGELVEKGKISANDAKETARKISDDGKQEFESASATLQEKFDELLSKMGQKNSERIDSLETKVSELEARLSESEAANAKSAKSK